MNYILQSPLCRQKIQSKNLDELSQSVTIHPSTHTRFGFKLLTSGCRIIEIENGSKADQAGFRKGDKILKGPVSNFQGPRSKKIPGKKNESISGHGRIYFNFI